MNYSTYLLDGDNVRSGLNSDLLFDNKGRTENIRRVSHVAKLFCDSGQIVISAFISPFKQDRDYARSLLEKNEFVEVFVECPIEECSKRDPKGLYKKAIAGKIKDFTGISSPYEKPINPEIVISTHANTIDENVEKILNFLLKKEIINE